MTLLFFNSGSLWRSSNAVLDRAKAKTLKLTVVVVFVFILCWTPYNTMVMWYMVDRKSFQDTDQKLQKGLFLFACLNSVMDPVVYGFFHVRNKQHMSSQVSRSYSTLIDQ